MLADGLVPGPPFELPAPTPMPTPTPPPEPPPGPDPDPDPDAVAGGEIGDRPSAEPVLLTLREYCGAVCPSVLFPFPFWPCGDDIDADP